MKNFDEYMQHKVLSYKYSVANHSADELIGAVSVDDGSGGQRSAKIEDLYEVKNVCAKLHVNLVQRLDETLSLLSMSKREFIELAILEALNRVDTLADKAGVFEYTLPENQQ